MKQIFVYPIYIVTLFFCSCSSTESKLTAEELELFVTPRDFNRLYDYDFVISKEFEKTSKSGWFGEKEYSYEYSVPDSSENPLYINITVSYATKTSDAIVNYSAYDIGGNVGLTIADAKTVKRDSLFSYGDASSLQEIRIDSLPVGNMFITRSGSKVYHLIISGIYLSDPESWKELVLPRLERFSNFEPE